MPDDLDDLIRRASGPSAPVAEADPLDDLIRRASGPAPSTAKADPLDDLIARASPAAAPAPKPERTDIPPVMSGAFRLPGDRPPVGRFDEQIAAAKAKSAAEDAAFPVSKESRQRLLRAKFEREVERAGADPRVAQGGDAPSSPRLFAQTFPNIKTQADADYAEAQMAQSQRASRTAGEVADASVRENVAKLGPVARGALNAGTTVAGFARAATGGYFGGLIGNGERKESEHLDKLNAALESADGWTKYLHMGGEGLGAGVGIGGLGRAIGTGKAMAAYGAIATPGGVKERVLGAAEMAAFGKVAEFLTPSTQRMLARLPESLRGPVIAKAIDLSDEFAGGVFSETVMRSAKGEDITPEALVFSGFLNAAQASLRKVAAETPPTKGEDPGLAALRAEGPPPPPPAPAAPAEAPARPVEAPKPEVAPEATPRAAEPVAAPVEPLPASPEAPKVEAPAPEAPAAPREEVIQPAVEAPAPEAPPVEPPKVEPPPVEPPAPEAPKPPVEGEPFVTSLKRRIVDPERAARGREPHERGPVRPHEALKDEALRRMEKDPNYGRDLVRDIQTTGRVPQDSEFAALLVHRVDIQNQMKAAAEDGQAAFERARDAADEASRVRADLDRQAAVERGNAREIELAEVEAIVGQAKTRAGQSLGSLKMEMASDYSLTTLADGVARDQGYKPLSEAQAADVKAVHDQLKKAIEERDAALARASAAESGLALADIARSSSRKAPARENYGKANKIVTREAYEKAKAELRSELSQLSVNPVFNPKVYAKLVEIGTFHIEAGVRGFAAWAKAVRDEVGEEKWAKVEPHLKSVYDEANGKVVADISAEASAAIKAGESFVGPAGKLAEQFIASGVHGAENVGKAVHEVLKGIDPDITISETHRAIVDYGHATKMNMDPIKVELRDTKAQLTQVERLKDIAEGKMPPQQGLQRETPSDALRELRRRVQEAKKTSGLVSVDPARELKTALEATKTRLRNENKDLDRQIQARVKDIPNKKDAPSDPEVVALKARKAELREQFQAIFGKPGMSPAARLELAIKAGEKSIAELERRVATGDVFPGAKEVKSPGDPRLTAIREKQKALRQIVNDMKAVAKPRLSDSEILIRHLTRKAEALEKRIENKDFSTRERKERTIPPEAVAAEARVNAALERYQDLRFRTKREQMTKWEKAKAAPIEVASFIKAFLSTGDISGWGRQFGMLAVSNPTRLGGPTLKKMGGAFKSAESLDRTQAAIKMDPEYAASKRANLFLAEGGATNPSGRDEVFRSDLAEKIPTKFGGGLVRGSSRAYQAINYGRFQAWKLLRSFWKTGTQPTAAEDKQIAMYINLASGRGGPAGPSKFFDVAGIPFWAPRWWASRFQILAGQPLWKGTAKTRYIIGKEYIKSATGYALLYAAMKGLGGAIGGYGDDGDEDTKVSDFMKGVFDRVRIDPSSGFASAARMALDTVNATVGSTGLGSEDQEKASREWTARAGRHLRGKMHPVLGAAVSGISGRKITGQETSWGSEFLDLMIPMSPRESVNGMMKYGVPKGLAIAILNEIGVSVQIHSEDE